MGEPVVDQRAADDFQGNPAWRNLVIVYADPHPRQPHSPLFQRALPARPWWHDRTPPRQLAACDPDSCLRGHFERGAIPEHRAALRRLVRSALWIIWIYLVARPRRSCLRLLPSSAHCYDHDDLVLHVSYAVA